MLLLLRGYFHALGGHRDANRFLHDVIGSDPTESFGGDYGESVPLSLGFEIFPAGRPNTSVLVPPDATPIPPIRNAMSCLSMAEWLRRLVCVREEPLAVESWSDSVELLYGSRDSVLFEGLQWGGLSMGTDIYLQEAANMTEIDLRSQGHWRIFSKLGAGVSSTEHPGKFEITLNAYACFPVFRDATPEEARGLEFSISAALVASTGEIADELMSSLVMNVTRFLKQKYDEDFIQMK